MVPCTENVRQDCSTQWVHFRFMAVKLAKYMKLLLHNSSDNIRDEINCVALWKTTEFLRIFTPNNPLQIMCANFNGGGN